jgi:hypothetical protein
LWEVAPQSLYFMIVCLPRPQGGFKPVSAHFRTSGTTSGETFVVTDGPLRTETACFDDIGDILREPSDHFPII